MKSALRYVQNIVFYSSFPPDIFLARREPKKYQAENLNIKTIPVKTENLGNVREFNLKKEIQDFAFLFRSFQSTQLSLTFSLFTYIGFLSF